MSKRPTITAGDEPGTIVITFELDNGDRVMSIMDRQAAFEFAAEQAEALATAFTDVAAAAMYMAQQRDELATRSE